MSSRTLFGLVLLLTIVTAGPPSNAQQATRIPTVGWLGTTTQAAIVPFITAFRQGLRELGYVEGKTVFLEVRLTEGAVERLPQLARELVALKPDVIVFLASDRASFVSGTVVQVDGAATRCI